MESLNFTALFSLLDKEKQQMLLSQVNSLSAQKEVGQDASVGVSVWAPSLPSAAAGAVQQSKEKPAAIKSFTTEELLGTGKVRMAAQKYFKEGILYMTLYIWISTLKKL